MSEVAKRSELCSACKIRPVRGKDQRYCKECHNRAEKDRRRRLMDELRSYRQAAHAR